MRVMMIGPYPQSPARIDGGVSAAMTYLSQALLREPGIELVGVRIGGGSDRMLEVSRFDWPVFDLPLGKFGLSSFYRSQRTRLNQLIHQHRPDVIHAQGVDVEGFLAVRSGVPSVVTVHGVLGACARFKTGVIGIARAAAAARLTEKSTVRRAKDLIAISPYIADYYKLEIRGCIHEIPNAVGDAFFNVLRAPVRGRALFAGRISRGKGVLELIRAVGRDKNQPSTLILAGSCPDKAYGEEVRREIADLNLYERVKFVGLLSEEALLNEFARAEYLVLPSFQETAPMVIQQAMAAGLAVVATRVGGIPHLIDNNVTGFLTSPGDVCELASVFSAIARDEHLCARVGERARAVALSKYRADLVARSTRSVYRLILERPSQEQQ